MKAYNLETVLKADDWREFCFTKDLLRLTGIEQFEDDWGHESPKGASFSSDMDTHEIFIKNLNEEDVQSFGGLSGVVRLVEQYKVKFK